ncbi:hypothetical protein LBMAG53_39720 [Planctomycetota bacterium]|nr:hypothetical protein LBMAG53_39720 [Planctomycetota bacterium]
MRSMSMPVKLSDALVLDARMAGEAMERSIAGQVEFWARLGRAIDPLLNGSQAMAISRRGAARPLAELVAEVEMPAGQQRLAQHLAAQPFPHYEPHPERAGILVRTTDDGTRTAGRFVNRIFTPATDA